MRIFLPALFFVCFFTQLRAQNGYAGFTGDFNSGIGERYTYGLGLHVEARVRRCENLYFNWHYSIGSNTHGELYGHGGMSLLVYRSDAWWTFRPSSWDELAVQVIGPLLVPNGITYYMPSHSSPCSEKRTRIGIYCNPIVMEHWNTKPFKVTSWTIEGGVKFLYEMENDRVLYCAGGFSVTNNVRRQRSYGDYGNEEMVQLQIGILGVVD